MSTMTTEQYTNEFEARFEQFIGNLRALHDSKRRAYTGGRRPLENYEMAAATLAKMGAREDRGCLTIMVGRLQEKVNRIASLIGMDDFMTAERDESFEDTCMDIAVIAGLCVAERALLEAEKLPTIKYNDVVADESVPTGQCSICHRALFNYEPCVHCDPLSACPCGACEPVGG